MLFLLLPDWLAELAHQVKCYKSIWRHTSELKKSAIIPLQCIGISS